MKNNNYFPMPNEIFSLGLNSGEIAVYTYLMSCEDRKTFLQWLYDFEYEKLGLPRPDLIIYLDVPTDYTEKLMRQREHDTNTSADIHEKDMQYLATCRESGRTAAQYYGWHIVQCVKNDEMRSIEDIHEEIYAMVKRCLED